MKLLLTVLLVLLCSGCMQDDVSDLKTISETNLQENNRMFYAAGIRDGLIITGVSLDDATYQAELMADEVFNGY